MSTVDGRRVHVIDPGRLNTDAGPDFFNAKIRIGSDMWAGDVEIHVNASDWHRHRHDGDPAYNSVILHVVGRDDTQIQQQLQPPCGGVAVCPAMPRRDQAHGACKTAFLDRQSGL